MNKLMIGMIGAVCAIALMLSGTVCADTAPASVTVTNAQVATADIVASGWLDKIEFTGSALSTATVVVATFDASGTAIETLATVTLTANKVVAFRRIGTDNTGTALAAVYGGGAAGTNAAGTVLVGTYDRPMLGGYLKLKVTGASVTTNTVQALVFYQPTKK
jgi:hypothetical protein